MSKNILAWKLEQERAIRTWRKIGSRSMRHTEYPDVVVRFKNGIPCIKWFDSRSSFVAAELEAGRDSLDSIAILVQEAEQAFKAFAVSSNNKPKKGQVK